MVFLGGLLQYALKSLTPFSLWAVGSLPSWLTLPRQDQGKRPALITPALNKMKPKRLAQSNGRGFLGVSRPHTFIHHHPLTPTSGLNFFLEHTHKGGQVTCTIRAKASTGLGPPKASDSSAGHQGTLTSLSEMLTVGLSAGGKEEAGPQEGKEAVKSSLTPSLSSDITSSGWPSFSKYLVKYYSTY